MTGASALTKRQFLHRSLALLAVGAALWFFPVPAGLQQVAEAVQPGTEQLAAGTRAWRLFAVFATVIVAFLLRPFPMGPVTLAGLVLLAATGTLTTKQAMYGYGDTTTWLVVAAFLIAGCVLRSGLGRRLALLLVKWWGRSTLGLAYSQCAAEALLGSVIPSNTARGGGLLAPISGSLSEALDSTPLESPDVAGRYLTLVGAQANLIASSMYLTGMAANPLAAGAAREIFNIEFGWLTWLQGSVVPCLVALLLMPLFLAWLVPPTRRDTQAARQRAVEQLRAMGRLTRREWILAGVLLALIGLWASEPLHGRDATLVAWAGVVVLLLSGAESWEDATRNAAAWDTLIWLGGLLTMAGALNEFGFVQWGAQIMQGWVAGLDGLMVVFLLTVIYLYSMYGFSMLTAHITALTLAFFTVARSAGAPPMLTVALLCYFSTLCACLTNYSSGPIIIYFGLGYVSAPRWFGVGFLMSLFYLAIWFSVGMAWWKVIGWW